MLKCDKVRACVCVIVAALRVAPIAVSPAQVALHGRRWPCMDGLYRYATCNVLTARFIGHECTRFVFLFMCTSRHERASLQARGALRPPPVAWEQGRDIVMILSSTTACYTQVCMWDHSPTHDKRIKMTRSALALADCIPLRHLRRL